ncbi:ATP synthase subunit I [Intestinibacter sp.]|uniref:ATP synthase subunit I n=1 Tax=Intestinibacter sp. TaxID=1965304 RepID=UPI002A75CB4F|nr:ATP synthase subunit I [Intestinibacter sp.]MDY2735451.1 ATP synthase subunit I [Intestinibacter sp.]MDY4574371.1 ATP synthase subunit I [Intestinibacter sp.]
MDVKVSKEVKAVTLGVPIFDIVAVIVLMLISKFSMPMLVGIIFGSVIAVLNFRLLALTLEKAVNLPPGKAQAYTGVRYMIRLTITAAALIVSVKNPNLHIIGTAIGLISTQVVIFIKTLIASKFKRKEV